MLKIFISTHPSMKKKTEYRCLFEENDVSYPLRAVKTHSKECLSIFLHIIIAQLIVTKVLMVYYIKL